MSSASLSPRQCGRQSSQSPSGTAASSASPGGRDHEDSEMPRYVFGSSPRSTRGERAAVDRARDVAELDVHRSVWTGPISAGFDRPSSRARCSGPPSAARARTSRRTTPSPTGCRPRTCCASRRDQAACSIFALRASSTAPLGACLALVLDVEDVADGRVHHALERRLRQVELGQAVVLAAHRPRHQRERVLHRDRRRRAVRDALRATAARELVAEQPEPGRFLA